MKIQVLELPTEALGDYLRTPYALIVSEAGTDQQAAYVSMQLSPLTETEKPSMPEFVFVSKDEVEL